MLLACLFFSCINFNFFAFVKWSCSGHLLEFVFRNILVHTSVTKNSMEFSFASELEVKYNNIRKVCQLYGYFPSSSRSRMLIFLSIVFNVGLMGAFY